MQQTKTTPLHTPRMKRLSPGLWLVESRSTPGIGHKCTVDACGCKAGSFGRLCWHRRLVQQAEAWYAGSQWVAPQQAPAADHEASEAQSSSAAAPASVAQQAGPGELAPLWQHFE
jgi:hypothetical protein